MNSILFLLASFFAASLITIGSLFNSLHSNYQLQTDCRRLVLAYSLTVASSMNRLQELNKTSKKLRVRLKKAIIRLRTAAASGVLPAIAAAKIEVTYIIGLQVKHRLRQEAILLQQEKKRTNAVLKWQKQHYTESSFKRLLVRRLPMTSASPDFLPILNFTKMHISSLSFVTPIMKSKSFTSRCAGTVYRKGGQKWYAKITRGK